MKRSPAQALCVLLTAAALGAAPASQPGASTLEDQNRALRDALVELNLRNRSLESENARLKSEVKELQDRLARIAVPQIPQPAQPFRFQMPNTIRPYSYQQSPVPKNWVPKKFGDTDFFVIPIEER